MPKRTKNMITQVNELMDRLQRYADSVIGNDGKNGRPRQTGFAKKSDLKWSRVARSKPDGDEFVASDLDDWGTDGGAPSLGAEYAKEWAMLWDGKKEQVVARMLGVMSELRPAGAVKAEMDKAWEIFASVQCK